MSNSKQEIIVTGINGFVGEHLAKHLQESDFAVRGVGREETPNKNVQPYLDSYERADLLDKATVETLHLQNAIAIIHLAGLASVAESFSKPELYETGNAVMTDGLISAAKEQGFSGRILVISTGALYDTSKAQGRPITEENPTIESSPYATGKLRAEAVAKQYRKDGLDVVIARPFNHIGPGQGPGFLIPDLYAQLKKAQEENLSTISVGNLSTKRDYTDVRDIVQAYALLATSPILKYGLYNVSSSKSLSGFDILEHLKRSTGLEEITPIIDPSRVRPTDAPEIVGDSSRIRSELHWQPTLTTNQTIGDFIARETN